MISQRWAGPEQNPSLMVSIFTGIGNWGGGHIDFHSLKKNLISLSFLVETFCCCNIDVYGEISCDEVIVYFRKLNSDIERTILNLHLIVQLCNGLSVFF